MECLGRFVVTPLGVTFLPGSTDCGTAGGTEDGPKIDDDDVVDEWEAVTSGASSRLACDRDVSLPSTLEDDADEEDALTLLLEDVVGGMVGSGEGMRISRTRTTPPLLLGSPSLCMALSNSPSADTPSATAALTASTSSISSRVKE